MFLFFVCAWFVLRVDLSGKTISFAPPQRATALCWQLEPNPTRSSMYQGYQTQQRDNSDHSRKVVETKLRTSQMRSQCR